MTCSMACRVSRRGSCSGRIVESRKVLDEPERSPGPHSGRSGCQQAFFSGIPCSHAVTNAQTHGTRPAHRSFRCSRRTHPPGARAWLFQLFPLTGRLYRRVHAGAGKAIWRSARQVQAHRNDCRSRRPRPPRMEFHSRARHDWACSSRNPRVPD
jgi:hypothetical protein